MAKVVLGADPFGSTIKDIVKEHLQAKGMLVEDRGVHDKYYEIAHQIAKEVSKDPQSTKAVLCCGTGMGMSIIANKQPGVYAAVVESADAASKSRSINNSNVLALGGMGLSADEARDILDRWLSTEFTQGWEQHIQEFLHKSMEEIPQLEPVPAPSNPSVTLEPIFEAVPNVGSDRITWCCYRDVPTRALVKFPAGAIEPAHHHTTGHDVFVVDGSKRVDNLTTGESFLLHAGANLFVASLCSASLSLVHTVAPRPRCNPLTPMSDARACQVTVADDAVPPYPTAPPPGDRLGRYRQELTVLMDGCIPSRSGAAIDQSRRTQGIRVNSVHPGTIKSPLVTFRFLFLPRPSSPSFVTSTGCIFLFGISPGTRPVTRRAPHVRSS